MTELELLIDFHQDADRQGPGSTTETLRALALVGLNRAEPLRIADIGCGTGAQTLVLAQHAGAHITAVDLYPAFLARLAHQTQVMGLQERVTPLQADMNALPFEDEEWDVIWSEGAVYNIGFETGVKQWYRYLKKGGYLAVSEITWTTQNRPEAIERHWQREYPEIDTAANKMKVLESQGYSPVGYFVLPDYCWTDNYYTPMEHRFARFLERHPHSESARQIIVAEQMEINHYYRYKDYFNYGFYIARKV